MDSNTDFTHPAGFAQVRRVRIIAFRRANVLNGSAPAMPPFGSRGAEQRNKAGIPSPGKKPIKAGDSPAAEAIGAPIEQNRRCASAHPGNPTAFIWTSRPET
jgi:hypothetical protein